MPGRLFFYGLGEEAMKKLAFVFAAIAVAAMTGANAGELGVRVDGDRDMYRDRDFRAARAEFAYGEHDRGLHRGRAGARPLEAGPLLKGAQLNVSVQCPHDANAR